MRQPKLLTKIWAAIGLKNTIPESRGSGLAQGAATYDEGFPSITMTPIAQGGKAPSGKDMNGILHELSAHIVHMNQGGHYKFDSGFAEKINGYSRGAVLINNDETAFFVSLIDQNKTDFNGGSDYGDYWIKLADVEAVKQVHPKDLTEESISEKDHTGHSHRLPVASLIKKGIVQLNNTLTSTSQEQALTAAQGKVLKDLVDKFHITETTADANTLTTDGIYAYTTAAENKNLPSNHNYHLFVMGGGNAGWCRQIAKKAYGLETYERTKTSYNGEWSAWKRTDILGFSKYISTENLNDITEVGLYGQNLNVNATPERNYPEQKAGTLFVTPSAYGVQQEYTTFNSNNKYVRGKDNNRWLAWKKINASDWVDVSNRPRTLDGYATTMNGQFTLNHLAAFVKGQRNSVDSWFVGLTNNESNDVALHSYIHETGIKLKSDRVESNKPLYVNSSPVFTEATLTPVRDTNLTAFIPNTQVKYQDATPAQLPVGTHMGFSTNSRLTDNGVYSGWGMVSKPNNSATSAVRFGANNGSLYFQQANLGNHNEWLSPVKVETEKHTEVDLSTLDPNIWYPVVITGISSYVQEKIRVSHNLFVAGNAEWGNYSSNKGFSLLCEWRVNNNAWGVIPHSIVVHSFAYEWTKDSKSPLLKIGQLTNSGSNYCLLRGGTKYDVFTPAHCNVSIKSSNYTINGQSINLLTLAEYDDRLKPVTIFNELKNIANAKQSPATTLAGYGITDGVRRDEFFYQKVGDFEIRKYPDGMMIQTGIYRRGTRDFNRNYYDTDLVTLIYPVAFADNPCVSITPHLSHPYIDSNNNANNQSSGRLASHTHEANNGVVGLTVESNRNKCQFTYQNGDVFISEMSFHIIAIGRWK
ncbi:hypothetical protein ACWIUH_11455 [Ursidibacter arcticus]